MDVAHPLAFALPAHELITGLNILRAQAGQ